MSVSRSAFFRLTLLLILLLMPFGTQLAAQQTLRIGVIDNSDGSILKGAHLAAQYVNGAGGITGADGTVFNLAVVDTPPDNMDIAIANMGQARVIAVLGPETDALVVAHLTRLEALGVPILTPATGDTVLLQGSTDLFFRSRAQASVQTRALADYLVNTLDIRSIQTIQLDMTSTASLITLANELSNSGVRLSNVLLDTARPDLDQIGQSIEESEPDAVTIFGPPALVAQAYNRIHKTGFQGPVVYNHASNPSFTNIVPSDALAGIISTATWSYAQDDAISEQFILAFSRAFGHLPDALGAAGYDAVQLVASAVVGSGTIAENLASIQDIDGVQGKLSPAGLPLGETSSNVVVTRLNEYGSASIVARYRWGQEVAQKYISATSVPATPAPTPTPSGYHLTIESDFQNVRSGPGLQFDIIGQLPRGTQARVLGATADYSWLVIDFRGQWGWLASYLVNVIGNRNLVPIIQPPATPTPAPTSTPAPPRDPDLVVLHAHPPLITLGQPMAVSVTMLNQGLTAAGSFAIAASLEPGGRYVGVNLPGLDAGQQATVQLSETLSGVTGPQSVIIVVDLNEQVPESPTGEANNRVYAYNYVADRAILASGKSTISAGSVDLDGFGIPDFSWTGSDWVALGNASMYLMNDFTSIDDVHYDAIDTTLANIKTLHSGLLTNAPLGVLTADGHHGVIKLTRVTPDGQITIEYRVYR